jgi:hypothetical protein
MLRLAGKVNSSAGSLQTKPPRLDRRSGGVARLAQAGTVGNGRIPRHLVETGGMTPYIRKDPFNGQQESGCFLLDQLLHSARADTQFSSNLPYGLSLPTESV